MKASHICLVWLVGLALAFTLLAYLSWLDSHDQAVEKAANQYTACVKATYHMTPQAYVAQEGYYPTCDL